MHVPGSRRPPVVHASNHDIAPGASPVRSARNAAISCTFRSPMSSHDSPRDISNEETKQKDGMPNSARAYEMVHETSPVATQSGLYTVEAQRVSIWKRGGIGDGCRGPIRQNEMVPTSLASMDIVGEYLVCVRFCCCGCCTRRSITICS